MADNDGITLQKLTFMVNQVKYFMWRFLVALLLPLTASAEPIFHEKYYPLSASGKVPGVMLLHTSGGYASIKEKIAPFLNAGYAVYTPDFFTRHGLTASNRFETWTVHRTAIENELTEILQLMKSDPKVDAKNIFAAGYSNGGYWAAYLAATGKVNAGVTYYGVWNFPGNSGGYPAAYFENTSNPVLALVGRDDRVQRFENVSEQTQKASKLSKALTVHIYSAGHGWDCSTCRDYKYDATITADGVEKALKFLTLHSVP